MEQFRRQAWLSWASVGLLAVLCGALALLQHQWLGEISRAEGDRLRTSLQAELGLLSRDFNTEITSACAALIPSTADIEKLGREKAYSSRYFQWKESHDPLSSASPWLCRMTKIRQWLFLCSTWKPLNSCPPAGLRPGIACAGAFSPA